MYRLLFALGIAVFMMSSASYAIDDDSLVLYCPFEEGAGDETIDQASGQVGFLNGVGWTADGKIGGAVEFTAADNFIEFPEDAVMDITGSITMEAWIYPIQVQTDSGILGRRDSANVGGYCMQWTNAMVEMWIHIGGWQGTRGLQAGLPATEEWHHIVGIFDDGKIIQYVDGEVDSELAPGGGMESVPETFRIGQAQTSLESMFGFIDEVAVYNRALTEDEIMEDMQQGVISPVSPQGSLATTWAAIRSK